MIKGTYKLISDEQLNERIKRREDEIKQLVYDEYENYKKFIEFDGLPPILEIVVENIPRVDASVRTKAQKIELKINKKFLKENLTEYLKIILFHEFTHIWDEVRRYGTCAPQLKEYHAVQVAFLKNIGQENYTKSQKFSDQQIVWNYDKEVTVKEYIKELFEEYSYRMEYNYYNESKERTEKYMYDLCQWMGYSIICEKFCVEWKGSRIIDVFIPKEIKNEVEILYLSLKNNCEIKQIVRTYSNIRYKFGNLNKIQICGEENYFLSENGRKISKAESFQERCKAIENIYNDMKRKHTPKKEFSRDYLNKSFVFQYFCEEYKTMQKIISIPSLLQKYLQHYLLDCPENEQEMLNAFENLKNILETPRYFEIIINKIKVMNSVEIIVDDNGREYYYIKDLERFISEMKYTPAFLSSLLMGIADAGYLIRFSGKEMIIEK